MKKTIETESGILIRYKQNWFSGKSNVFIKLTIPKSTIKYKGFNENLLIKDEINYKYHLKVLTGEICDIMNGNRINDQYADLIRREWLKIKKQFALGEDSE